MIISPINQPTLALGVKPLGGEPQSSRQIRTAVGYCGSSNWVGYRHAWIRSVVVGENMAGYQSIRVVITGIGVVSPIGIGKDAFWRSLREGRSGVDFLQSIPADSLPSPYAAEVSDFDPRDHLRDLKFLKVMSRGMQLGVSSASLAMKDSGIGDGDIDLAQVLPRGL